MAFRELMHFAGFDWASEKHDVAVVDRQGRQLLKLQFPDTAEGWGTLRAKLAALLAPVKDLGQTGGRAAPGPGPDGLSDESQGGRAVPRPQGAQRGQG
jgi:hypothetical protein